MKFSIDVNIFLYATDSENPFHAQSIQFLQKQIAETEECYLVWDTIYAFLRIATHPTIFENPLSPKVALANMKEACEALNATMLSPDESSWDIFAKLNQQFPIRGKLVPDAVLASVLETNGISRIYSHDRDFWKFPFLKPIDPISQK